MMTSFCCIRVTLAARFIGILDLSTSILAINFIAGEFFADEQRLFVFDGIKIFLGLNWTNTSTSSQRIINHKWILICLVIYSIIHFICSAGLILATIFKKKTHATPWLIFEVISLMNQARAITVYIVQHRCTEEVITDEPVYVPLASLYLILGAYFWFVVYTARKSWPSEISDEFSESNKSVLVLQEQTVDFNSSKSLSVLAEHHISTFESPKPAIPSKYYEL